MEFPAHSQLGGQVGITEPVPYKILEQWVKYAKECTAKIKENGFSSNPVVWLFVEGNDIPPNAMIAGNDRGEPLYIARTFFEGSLLPGKAGHRLDQGAAIPFNGREVWISEFEVLVQATSLGWDICKTSVNVTPSLESRNKSSQAQKPKLEHLSLIKTVVVVDDSASMLGQRWSNARNALAGVADINAKFSSDGVDIFFLNDHRSRSDLRDQRAVHDLFDKVDPIGQTPTGRKLKEVLDIYIPKLEDKDMAHKPISIIVITDGIPSDDPAEVIIEAARRLDDNNVPQRSLGIQFVQIGGDVDATKALKELDDGLSGAHGIRDIVDTTLFDPSDPEFKTDSLIKILMGAINYTLDNAKI